MQVREVDRSNRPTISKGAAESTTCMVCLELVGKHSTSDKSRHLAQASESYAAFFTMMREFYFEIYKDLPNASDIKYRQMFKIEDEHIKKFESLIEEQQKAKDDAELAEHKKTIPPATITTEATKSTD